MWLARWAKKGKKGERCLFRRDERTADRRKLQCTRHQECRRVIRRCAKLRASSFCARWQVQVITVVSSTALMYLDEYRIPSRILGHQFKAVCIPSCVSVEPLACVRSFEIWSCCITILSLRVVGVPGALWRPIAGGLGPRDSLIASPLQIRPHPVPRLSFLFFFLYFVSSFLPIYTVGTFL